MISRHLAAVESLVLLTLPALGQQTTRVSVTSFGVQSTGGDVAGCAVSPDGRYVVFDSPSPNLVLSDTNNVADVFLHDRLSGNTQRVSVSSTGTQGNFYSATGAVSSDGMFVGFQSDATNLVAGDTNGTTDIFVRDVVGGTTVRVSVNPAGLQANSASANCDLSADGMRIVFESAATNLVTPDTNGWDIYVHDRIAGTTTRLSQLSNGIQANSSCSEPRISPDGTWSVFRSGATNLVSGDLNGVDDVFVVDILTGTLQAVTVDPSNLIGNGQSGFPDVSAAGLFVAFRTSATNLAPGDLNNAQDVLVWDRQNGSFARASEGLSGGAANGSSHYPSISSDGRVVAFSSDASNLVAGDTNARTDIFRCDMLTGAIDRMSVSDSLAQSDGYSFANSISANGQTVAFNSYGTNLVPGDTNSRHDTFVRAPHCSDQVIYCTAKTNSNGCVPMSCSTGVPSLSGPDAFTITAYRVLNQKSGFLFWGYSPTAIPFGGGTRCVGAPVRRTPVQNSAGSTTINDCSGRYDYLFTAAYMASWSMYPGQHLYAQWWSRDPFLAVPDNVGLTDAVEFVVVP